jgi:hypothetical protein
MKPFKFIAAIITALLALGWLGLRIKPKPFPPFPQPSGEPDTQPLPDGLPEPVARFYRTLYGDRLPLIESAVLTGRATLRLGGITCPGRFRFVHQAGQNYRHYIEVTLFGGPVMRVNEHYLDGVSRMALPFGVTENDPQVNQAANLALWGEAMWFPALFISDARVRWSPLLAHSARLHVPFEDSEEIFTVWFDPDSGLPRMMEAMRFKDPGSTAKTPWRNELLTWTTLNGQPLFSAADVTWLEEGAPWARFTVEEAVFNTDVSEYVRAAGL